MGYKEEYQRWLEMFAADAETIAELKGIEGDEKEIEDRFYTELAFGTAGLRGVLGMGTNRMNVYNVRRATMGVAKYLIAQGVQDQGVAIAYDSRIKSDVFAKETALTLAAAGVKAYLFFEDRNRFFRMSVVPQTVSPFLEILDQQCESLVIFHQGRKIGGTVAELKICIGLARQIDDLL